VCCDITRRDGCHQGVQEDKQLAIHMCCDDAWSREVFTKHEVTTVPDSCLDLIQATGAIAYERRKGSRRRT
jgi:hypothetical protein